MITYRIVSLAEIQVNHQDESLAYWLSLLRMKDWRALLDILAADEKTTHLRKKSAVAAEVLRRCTFAVGGNIGETANERRRLKEEGKLAILIQFRHPENDWSTGTPEILLAHDSMGFCNIAARILCVPKEEVLLTSHYWDCECETFYIHARREEECQACGARRADQPLSRVNEVLDNCLPLKTG